MRAPSAIQPVRLANALSPSRLSPIDRLPPAQFPATHRALLRAATLTAHEQVDARFSRFDLTTLAGYRVFLSAHWSVLPALEATLSLAGAATLLSDWPLRLRASALAADLAAVGKIAVPADNIDPEPITRPAMLGMLYVLEGSRLGGAVLARRVAASPDARCREATRYLRHGERRRFWPSFVAMFDALPLVADHIDEVITGARAAFDLFADATPDDRQSAGALS